MIFLSDVKCTVKHIGTAHLGKQGWDFCSLPTTYNLSCLLRSDKSWPCLPSSLEGDPEILGSSDKDQVPIMRTTDGRETQGPPLWRTRDHRTLSRGTFL